MLIVGWHVQESMAPLSSVYISTYIDVLHDGDVDPALDIVG